MVDPSGRGHVERLTLMLARADAARLRQIARRSGTTAAALARNFVAAGLQARGNALPPKNSDPRGRGKIPPQPTPPPPRPADNAPAQPRHRSLMTPKRRGDP